MGYSTESAVEGPLHDYGWDQAMPRASGDFFSDSEFEFQAQNGTDLHRVFDHTVVLQSDGAATATTAMTIENTAPASKVNFGSPAYIVAYGPEGARVGKGSDASFYAYEPSVNGHPAADWLQGAPPLGHITQTVVWNFRNALQPLGHGLWAYRLQWRPLPAHRGDVLRLHVELPEGWRWVGKGPPSQITLHGSIDDTWDVRSPS
ncbi:MAG: hypothetical protein ACRD6W_18315, partial [Nitrososphaerales archaeon]